MVKFKTCSLRLILVRISSLILSLCKECFSFGNYFFLLNDPVYEMKLSFSFSQNVCFSLKVFKDLFRFLCFRKFMSSAHSGLKYSFPCHILTATLATCTIHFVQCKHKPICPSNKHKGSYQMFWIFQQIIFLISNS